MDPMGIVIVFAVTSILKVVCPLCFAFQICSGIVLKQSMQIFGTLKPQGTEATRAPRKSMVGSDEWHPCGARLIFRGKLAVGFRVCIPTETFFFLENPLDGA